MRLFSFITVLFSLTAYGGTTNMSMAPVVYGEDDRIEVYQATASVQLLARSTATKFFRSNVERSTDGFYSIDQATLGESGTMCSDVPFLNQPSSGECSGFLIGPDLLVTAGHCTDSQIDCDNTLWVFDFHIEQQTGRVAQRISPANVYSCKKIIRQVENSSTLEDYALVQLERIVQNRAPLRFRSEGRIADDAVLTLIGNSSRLPTKVVVGSRLTFNTEDVYFGTTADSFQGNSGSAVINEATLEVEGIMVRGAEDYVFDEQRMCSQVNRCPLEGCNPSQGQRGEEATRITQIPELRLQQKVLLAARTGDLDEIQSYLHNGGWVDIYDNSRQSMLIKAIQGEQIAVVRELLASRADKNLRDLQGETPLHAAVRKENIQLVQILLASGANASIRNLRGKTPAQLGGRLSLKQRRIRRLLLQATQNNG